MKVKVKSERQIDPLAPKVARDFARLLDAVDSVLMNACRPGRESALRASLADLKHARQHFIAGDFFAK